MTRPNFIVPEQISAWDENIKNDIELQKATSQEFINSPEIKEVLYSGLWLVEELTKLGYDDDLIIQLQYSHGRQSFGNDPWHVAQVIVNGFKIINLKGKN